VTNKTNHRLQAWREGRCDRGMARRGAPGTWTPHVFKIAALPSSADHGQCAGKWCRRKVAIKPLIVRTVWWLCLVVDHQGGGRQFLTTFARTFAVSSQHVRYPHFCLDELPLLFSSA